MIFEISWASGRSYGTKPAEHRDISTLDELLALQDEVGEDLIIRKPRKATEYRSAQEREILVYDDYIE